MPCSSSEPDVEIVFDQEVVDVAGEDAPFAVARGRDVADGDVRGEVVGEADGADAGVRHAGDVKAVDDDVGRAFEIDAVTSNRYRLSDEDAWLGEELDGSGKCTAGLQLEAGIVARPHGDEVAWSDVVGGVLKRSPGSES